MKNYADMPVIYILLDILLGATHKKLNLNIPADTATTK